jgi:hypothetical protein
MRKNKLNEMKRRNVIRRLLKEEMLMFESYSRTCDLIIREEKRMIQEGYSPKQINEDLGSLLSNLGGDVLVYFKRYFIQAVLTKIGFDVNSFVGKMLVECLKNFEFLEISKYFGDRACEEISDELLKCMTDYVSGEGLDAFGQLVFGENFQGIISGTLRQTLQRNLNLILKDVRADLVEKICDIKFSELASGLKNLFTTGSIGGA